MGEAGADDRVLADGVAGEVGDDGAPGEDEDAVAFEQFGVLGRVPEHEAAIGGAVAQHAVEVALGADVDAAGRVVEEDDGGAVDQAAGHQRLLLVAAGEREDRVVQALGREGEALGGGAGGLRVGAGVDEADGGEAGGAADGDVVADAPERKDALGLAVAGNEAGAGGAGGVAGPGGRRREQAAEEGLLAAAFETGEADDLAGAELDRAAEGGGHGAVEADEDGAFGTGGDGGCSLDGGGGAADGLDEGGEGGVGAGTVPDDGAVAHGDDAVGDLEDLVELVADEDDGEPLGRPFGDVGVEGPGLRRAERGGGLVEDEQAQARVVGGAGDLEHLAAGDVEGADSGVRIDAGAGKDAGEAVADGRAVGTEPERAGARGFRGFEEEVLGRGEVRAQRELLVDDADAVRLRLARAEGGGVGDGPVERGSCRRRVR